jgi:hypothetical protein
MDRCERKNEKGEGGEQKAGALPESVDHIHIKNPVAAAYDELLIKKFRREPDEEEIEAARLIRTSRFVRLRRLFRI